MNRPSFSPELLAALRGGTLCLSVVAASSRGRDLLSCTTNDVPAFLDTFAGYCATVQGWPGGRITVVARLADGTSRTFLDLVGSRRRLETFGAMALAWLPGPEHPKGGAP